MDIRKNSNYIDRVKTKFHQSTLLWQYMLMIISVLIVAICALVCVSRISVNRLRSEKISEMRMKLERDAERMDDIIFSTTYLPAGIETSTYYRLFQTNRSGSLDKEYYPVLSMLRDSLLQQTHFHGARNETMLYFNNVNSIVTNRSVYPEAEVCFDEDYIFSEHSRDIILEFLRTKNSLHLLPMDIIQIQSDVPKNYISFISHPLGSSVAVMSLYSEDQILDMLSYSLLPNGTHMKLKAIDGQDLYTYPEEIENLSDYCEINVEMKRIRASATINIPNSYFESQIFPARIVLTSITAAVVLIGLTMAFVLSNAAVLPLRNLISIHGGGQNRAYYNEIQYLDNIIHQSTNQKQELQLYLARQMLSRALSGTMLTEAEEKSLKDSGLLGDGPFCVAILHTGPDINTRLGAFLQEETDCISWTIINQKETGCIIKTGSTSIQQYIAAVEKFVQSVIPQYPKGVCCGISAAATNISELYAASHQARTAMPQKPGCRVFNGEAPCSKGMTWVQHERLYQSIFTNDRAGSEKILDMLTGKANHQNGKEMFYIIRMVLISAAEEIGVELSSDQIEYDDRELLEENLEHLKKCLLEVHDTIQNRQDTREISLAEEITAYVYANMSDSNLCAAVVAEHFGITEKRVYESVRQITGKSFGEYLVLVRMKRAAKLLSTTQDSISDIMEVCGYPGSSTFYRLFKKVYGVPPGEFRNGIVDENGQYTPFAES